jgi:hypothetical protein
LPFSLFCLAQRQLNVLVSSAVTCGREDFSKDKILCGAIRIRADSA